MGGGCAVCFVCWRQSTDRPYNVHCDTYLPSFSPLIYQTTCLWQFVRSVHLRYPGGVLCGSRLAFYCGVSAGDLGKKDVWMCSVDCELYAVLLLLLLILRPT